MKLVMQETMRQIEELQEQLREKYGILQECIERLEGGEEEGKRGQGKKRGRGRGRGGGDGRGGGGGRGGASLRGFAAPKYISHMLVDFLNEECEQSMTTSAKYMWSDINRLIGAYISNNSLAQGRVISYVDDERLWNLLRASKEPSIDDGSATVSYLNLQHYMRVHYSSEPFPPPREKEDE